MSYLKYERFPMWQNEVLVWQSTEDHDWNNFGEEATDMVSYDNPAYAGVMVFWRSRTMSDFVQSVIDGFIVSTKAHVIINNEHVIYVFTLFTIFKNLIPTKLYLIKDDEKIEKFIDLLHTDDEGNEFFLTSELKENKELSGIVSYLTENNLLVIKDINSEKLFINGKVLAKAHLWDSKKGT